MKLKILTLLFSFLLITNTSYGYLDPGSGSYILQLLIAGGVASLYTIKVYWKSIKNFSKRVFHRKK